MAGMTRRCAVCTDPVPLSSIFCSKGCQRMGRVIRDAQATADETFTLADQRDVADTNPIVEQLSAAGVRHRSSVTTILAAYTQADHQLDAIIWAAHTHGLSDRDIGEALEMRTSSVRRRVLAFQARLHGPAPATAAVAG